MAFIRLNSQNLFYTRSTENEPTAVSHQPALILLHGAGGTHLDWPEELRRLEKTAVYALDLPGHGRSDQPGRATVDAYADDVLAFISALKLENVVVAGHSMGGAIAQTVALRRPSELAGIILVGTGARLRVTQAILDRILTDFETAVETIVHYYWASSAPPELIEFNRRNLMKNDPAVLYDDYAACNVFDVMNQISRIETPTLVISGTADQMTPLKYGRYLADNIPGAKLVILEGGGHMMALEQPERTTAVIDSFLSTCM